MDKNYLIAVFLVSFRYANCGYTSTNSYQSVTPTNSKSGLESLGDICGQCRSMVSKDNQQLAICMLTKKILELEGKLDTLQQAKVNLSCNVDEGKKKNATNTGVTYVRWGRTICPGKADLLYEGYAGKSYYSHKGGGGEYLCLPKDPDWPEGVRAGTQSGSSIFGVEYQEGALISDVYQHEAPCAVCQVSGHNHVLMIPAKLTCPSGWTKEYSGLLMAEKYTHSKSSFACVDGNPEVVPGSAENTNGGLFYTVEANCGESLPCPPYVEGYELSCVVCTI